MRFKFTLNDDITFTRTTDSGYFASKELAEKLVVEPDEVNIIEDISLGTSFVENLAESEAIRNVGHPAPDDEYMKAFFKVFSIASKYGGYIICVKFPEPFDISPTEPIANPEHE